MATTNNITMRQYNGVDYDTLLPKSSTSQININDQNIIDELLITSANANTGDGLDSLFKLMSEYCWWEKFSATGEAAYYSSPITGTYINTYVQNSPIFTVSETATVDENGNVTLVDPTTITVTTSNVTTIHTSIKGFGYISESTNYLTAGTLYYFSPYSAGTTYLQHRVYNTYISITESSSESASYVPSISETDYTENTLINGYIYRKKGILSNKISIQTGNYTGTGVYGSANPNSISFNFAPKLVILLGAAVSGTYVPYFTTLLNSNAGYQLLCINIDMLTVNYVRNQGFVISGTTNNSYAAKSPDGKTVYWYHTTNAGAQANSSDYVFYWLAIG